MSLLEGITTSKDQEQFIEEIQLAHKYGTCLNRNTT